MKNDKDKPKPETVKEPEEESLATASCYPLECWSMKSDTICAVRTALEAGIENTQELLIDHDQRLGRTTRSNRHTAEMLEGDIREMKSAFEKLKEPDGIFQESSHLVEKQFVRKCLDSAETHLNLDVNGIHPHAVEMKKRLLLDLEVGPTYCETQDNTLLCH